MKNCTDCKHAIWDKTSAGRLHPGGGGICKYPWKMPDLPQAFYWISRAPHMGGGNISRRKDLQDHCVYYARKA
jgi:hypothetical protein